ncbi:MAG: HAD-IB family hydrolase [Myxococcota bacterium]
MEPKAAAFFDLDRTLLGVNSGTLWAKHELLHGNISPRQFGRVAVWNVLYHLALIDIHTAFNQAVAHYRGRHYDELQRETKRWFLREVAHHLRPGANRALAEHRSQGHRLVLLTSASAFASRVAVETWGLDDFLSNDFPTDADGKLDGTFRSPLCYGKGKVEHAREWSEAQGIDLANCYFYSDSLTDFPMLDAVGHPRVVAPDPRLKRAAKERNWPIIDWDGRR